MMQHQFFTKNAILKYIVTSLVFVFLLTAWISFIVMQIKSEQQKQKVEIAQKYTNFTGNIQNFLINHLHMMKGFAAYMQTFEEYPENEVNRYLECLLNENQQYIKSIALVKDTKIIWVYPQGGNEKAIGADLSQIPLEGETIKTVQKNLQYNFDGPIDLVQGGAAYVMRLPLVKEQRYWGMITIVLKGDKVKELFDSYAENEGIQVAIISKSNDNRLVYGEPMLINQGDAVFESTLTNAQWETFVTTTGHHAMASIRPVTQLMLLGLMLIMIATCATYRCFRLSEEIADRNYLLHKEVMRDGLTEIYNRKYFDLRIIEETEHVNRYGGALSIVFFDLDHFKRINDTYGHSYGDNVLKDIVASVRPNIRACDVLARWGGEEFVLLMPETTLLGATATAEKLRFVLEQLEHPVIGTVTASFGVAQYFKDEFIGSLFSRVDDALYVSKLNGRNKVTGSASQSYDWSVLTKIHWNTEWNSGNELIDEEHKTLFKRANDLIESSYRHGSNDRRTQQAEDFAIAMSVHFSNEEKLLKQYNYMNVEEHIQAHRTLRENVRIMTEQLSHNRIGPREVFQFFQKELVAKHLMTEDTKYYSLLK